MSKPLFFLLCLVIFVSRAAAAETVRLPGPGGIVLSGELVLPEGPARPPAIVALHGCGGPFPARDRQWAAVFAAQGHVVLFPDSFGSRGLGSQCRVRHRGVTASGLRREDAFAAAAWLAARPGAAGRIALVGWSDGGSTVLAAAREAADQPRKLFTAFVAFYPGCGRALRHPAYRPSAPLLILAGENDDWTPIAPCRLLAAAPDSRVELLAYPDSWHDFDAPGLELRRRSGLATAPGGSAHAGTNPAARADALRRVPAFLQAHP